MRDRKGTVRGEGSRDGASRLADRERDRPGGAAGRDRDGREGEARAERVSAGGIASCGQHSLGEAQAAVQGPGNDDPAGRRVGEHEGGALDAGVEAAGSQPRRTGLHEAGDGSASVVAAALGVGSQDRIGGANAAGQRCDRADHHLLDGRWGVGGGLVGPPRQGELDGSGRRVLGRGVGRRPQRRRHGQRPPLHRGVGLADVAGVTDERVLGGDDLELIGGKPERSVVGVGGGVDVQSVRPERALPGGRVRTGAVVEVRVVAVVTGDQGRGRPRGARVVDDRPVLAGHLLPLLDRAVWLGRRVGDVVVRLGRCTDADVEVAQRLVILAVDRDARRDHRAVVGRDGALVVVPHRVHAIRRDRVHPQVDRVGQEAVVHREQPGDVGAALGAPRLAHRPDRPDPFAEQDAGLLPCLFADEADGHGLLRGLLERPAFPLVEQVDAVVTGRIGDLQAVRLPATTEVEGVAVAREGRDVTRAAWPSARDDGTRAVVVGTVGAGAAGAVRDPLTTAGAEVAVGVLIAAVADVAGPEGVRTTRRQDDVGEQLLRRAGVGDGDLVRHPAGDGRRVRRGCCAGVARHERQLVVVVEAADRVGGGDRAVREAGVADARRAPETLGVEDVAELGVEAGQLAALATGVGQEPPEALVHLRGHFDETAITPGEDSEGVGRDVRAGARVRRDEARAVLGVGVERAERDRRRSGQRRQLLAGQDDRRCRARSGQDRDRGQ